MPDRISFVNYKYAMRWKDINESPVGNYDVMGVSDQGSFRHREDRSIMASKKAEAKIRRILMKIPQVVDLVFFDTGFKTDDGAAQQAHWEEIGGPRQYADVRAAIPGFPTRSDPNAIMLMLTNNEGFQRVQLSGWIIAHRMGHALVFGDDFSNQFENIRYCLQDIYSMLRDGWMVGAMETYLALGTMKSCRERTLTQSNEFIFELFAQHCVVGKATLNRLDRAAFEALTSTASSDWGYVPKVQDRDIESINEMIESSERQINRAFLNILKAAEGLVVVL